MWCIPVIEYFPVKTKSKQTSEGITDTCNMNESPKHAQRKRGKYKSAHTT